MMLYGPDGEVIRQEPTEVDTGAAWYDTVLELLRDGTVEATATVAASEAAVFRRRDAGQANGRCVFEWGAPPRMLGLSMSEVTAMAMPQFSNGFRACGRRALIDVVERIDAKRIPPSRVDYARDAADPFVTVLWAGTDPMDERRPALALQLTATRAALEASWDVRLQAAADAVSEAGEVIDGVEG